MDPQESRQQPESESTEIAPWKIILLILLALIPTLVVGLIHLLGE